MFSDIKQRDIMFPEDCSTHGWLKVNGLCYGWFFYWNGQVVSYHILIGENR